MREPMTINDIRRENRRRLIRQLSKIPHVDSPSGWQRVTSMAVGGLTEIGFSKDKPHLLLILSHQGRGVVDCTTGEKVARDLDEFGDWCDERNLSCEGIGPIAGERVQMAGLHGGGLPNFTTRGERIELASPDWPEQHVIFCPELGSPFTEGRQESCAIIGFEQIRACGFSWSGNHMAVATPSDVTIFTRSDMAESRA